jgi:phosphoenolpyruvate phosphomutase
MKKTTQLKSMLTTEGTDFILEAHNGLSAKIVEEAGFKGIWASGLSLSAQFGVRDSNEASWTQILETVEFMADATSIPILLDGDTGYGNFNNFRRLIRKLEQRDIAGVCIEDKIFPKTNSFINGTSQKLADMDEFCGKIKAGKDSQSDDDFVIVARVEAFIAGHGLKEALKRAEAYRLAGADAILMHSALNRPDEVLEFKKEWGDRAPVVIVPTKYYSTPTEVFQDYGFSLVIWANHMMRASIRHMQNIANTIHRYQNISSIEDKVAPVKEVFRLQGVEELSRAEKSYLPQVSAKTTAIVLAAGKAKEMDQFSKNCPKAMLKICGKTLLERIVDTYHGFGVSDVNVVRGFAKAAFTLTGVAYHDNDDYDSTGEFVSLKTCPNSLAVVKDQDLIISYGDVLFSQSILMLLDSVEDSITVVIDPDSRQKTFIEKEKDYILASAPYRRESFFDKVYLKNISTANGNTAMGEWIGICKVSASKRAQFIEYFNAFDALPVSKTATLNDFINYMVEQGEPIRVIYNTGGWVDVDIIEDVIIAEELT